MTATYRVEHVTKYVYGSPVATSQHVAYLRPRELPHQHVRHYEIRIDPAPTTVANRIDAFGNIVKQFQILRPYSTLVVTAESVVDVCERAGALDPERSPKWEPVARELGGRADGIPVDVTQFAQPSTYLPFSQAMDRFARRSFPPGRPVLAGAINLMHRIHSEFAFDPAATTVTTPLVRVLDEKRGVCQDFAHVAISSLRAIGLAARYVSGYLLTDPPPGQPRLIGADASHAWLSVFCPVHGWVDLDPTNDVIVGERHVTVAWGRDYGDVSPLRGVLLGGAQHSLSVGVSVVPMGAATGVAPSSGFDHHGGHEHGAHGVS
jgi:transglutaminase-like putative cysteine protease